VEEALRSTTWRLRLGDLQRHSLHSKDPAHLADRDSEAKSWFMPASRPLGFAERKVMGRPLARRKENGLTPTRHGLEDYRSRRISDACAPCPFEGGLGIRTRAKSSRWCIVSLLTHFICRVLFMRFGNGNRAIWWLIEDLTHVQQRRQTTRMCAQTSLDHAAESQAVNPTSPWSPPVALCSGFHPTSEQGRLAKS
jgi:hypothetical protein